MVAGNMGRQAARFLRTSRRVAEGYDYGGNVTNATLTTLASANRRARDSLTEEIYKDLWTQIHALTSTYLDKAKPWFQGMPDGKWSVDEAHKLQVLPHVNHATRELAAQISELFKQAAIELRRRCYLRGIKAAQVGQEIIGFEPVKPLDAVFRKRESVRVNGARVTMLGNVVAGKAVTILREAEPVLPNFTTIDPALKGKNLKRVLAIIAEIPPAIRRLPQSIVLQKDIGAQQADGVHAEWEGQTSTIKINPDIFKSKQKFHTSDTHGKIDQVVHALIHEYMHAWGERSKLDTSSEWLALSGWQYQPEETPQESERYVEKRSGWPKEKTPWVHAKDAWFTRHYGSKSPEEDFADVARDVLLGWDEEFKGGGEAKRDWMKAKLGTVGVKREADASDDTNIRARVLIPTRLADGSLGAWAIGNPPMLPGGGVKKGELITDAAIREVLEETGLKIKLSRTDCLCKVPQGQMKVSYFVGHVLGGKPTSLDHDGHTPVNPRIVPLDALTTEQDKAAVQAYLHT